MWQKSCAAISTIAQYNFPRPTGPLLQVGCKTPLQQTKLNQSKINVGELCRERKVIRKKHILEQERNF